MQAVTTNWLKRGGRRESQEVVFVHNNWSTVRLDPWDPGSIYRIDAIAKNCKKLSLSRNSIVPYSSQLIWTIGVEVYPHRCHRYGEGAELVSGILIQSQQAVV